MTSRRWPTQVGMQLPDLGALSGLQGRMAAGARLGPAQATGVLEEMESGASPGDRFLP